MVFLQVVIDVFFLFIWTKVFCSNTKLSIYHRRHHCHDMQVCTGSKAAGGGQESIATMGDDKQCSWRQPWRALAYQSLTRNSLGLSWQTNTFGVRRLTASPPNRASFGSCSHGRPSIVSCCSSFNQRSAVVVSMLEVPVSTPNTHSKPFS